MPALKELTAARLASLNHGSIRSPLPGSEAGIVLARVREWNRKVPEIHIGGDPRNPVIRVQLSDVDYESVVENAKGEDNEGRRRELLKDLVREAIGITERDPDVFGVYAHPVIWRGSRRGVDVVFGNVRDAGWLTEDHFRDRPGDLAVRDRLPVRRGGALGGRRPGPGRPAGRGRAEVPDDRVAAPVPVRGPDARRAAPGHPGLAAQRHRRALDHAMPTTCPRWTGRRPGRSWRASAPGCGRRCAARCRSATARRRRRPGTLAEDSAHDRVLVSLDSSFSPAAPVGADLAAAFGNLVDQAFSATYPGHPRFEPGDVEVTVRDLAAVYAHVERAVADPERRVRLEGDIAAVRRVANPLQVGMAAETHFLFGDDKFPWGAEFERAAARDGVQPQDPVTVGQIRGWLDAIRPELGLRDDVADLIVLAWAALRQRAWYQHGSSIPAPRPGAARPDMQLRPEPLPVPADWEAARSRAEVLFGIRANPYLTAAALAEFTETVRARLDVAADSAAGLVQRVELAYRHLGLAADSPGRLATARAGATFVESLRRAGGRVRLVKTLAQTELPATDTAVANSLSRAQAVASAVDAFRWDRLAPLRAAENQDDERGRAAARALAGAAGGGQGRRVRDRLGRALSAADDAIFDWLSSGQGSRAPRGGLATCPSTYRRALPRRSGGRATRAKGAPASEVLGPLQAFLEAHPDDQVVVEWRVQE